MRRKPIFYAIMVLILLPTFAAARITRIEITRVESPTFDGKKFAEVGQYEKIVGKAYGEVDPDDPKNAIITDIDLAPRNALGRVEYISDFYLLKPVDMSKGNGILFYALPNRGRKLTFAFLHHSSSTKFGKNDPTTAADAGDGFLMKRGYTILWGGVQGDLFPGDDRVILKVPVAKNKDGSEITDRMRTEYGLTAPTNTLYLSSSPYTGQTVEKTTHTPYETTNTDNCLAILTKRVHASEPRIPVWNEEWAFADCSTVPFPGVPDSKKICLKDGFDPNYIYELIYTAKNPKVLGLGFAACRDLTSFFRNAEKDDVETPNPLAKGIQKSILQGISQVGNFVRTFTDLGFNQDEDDRMVFDGMVDVIGPRRISLNVRFGRPGGAGMQHEDHLFPGNQSPFTWKSIYDPVANVTAGLLDSCKKTGTCPKIIQLSSSAEYWNSGMSLGTTDALGQHDIEIPENVRIYLFSSTQHAPASKPVAGICKYIMNPNPYREAFRALIVALEGWVTEKADPPPSRIPTLRDKTLVSPDKTSLGWPDIPGVKYTGVFNQISVIDYGPLFNNRNVSGITTEPPKVLDANYTMLVPKVDIDGNEIAGIRSTTLQAPLGTYTGWNLRRDGFGEDGLCLLNGMYSPFKKTETERLAAGDPRLSLEERYGNHNGYIASVRAAAERLVAQRFLLPEDAERLIGEAEESDVLLP